MKRIWNLSRAFIIAEIGSNCFKHRDAKRNLDNAIRQIGAAREYGADAVKFQFFTSEELWGPDCRGTTFSELQDKYALPFHWLEDLKKACDRAGLEFMCSAFSVGGFDIVSRYVKRHKLASPEVRAKNLFNYLFDKPKPVIFSLGCVTTRELPTFLERMRPKDVVLECVSKYPASMVDYDLHNIRQANCLWGISDHTPGSQLAVLARSKGACYFEKHVDFFPDEGGETPDRCVSISGNEFQKYVHAIRDQDVLDHDTEKRLSIKLYGRRKTRAGWFRPFPEGAPGVE
jgi:sialic acid synthase SpsE